MVGELQFVRQSVKSRKMSRNARHQCMLIAANKEIRYDTVRNDRNSEAHIMRYKSHDGKESLVYLALSNTIATSIVGVLYYRVGCASESTQSFSFFVACLHRIFYPSAHLQVGAFAAHPNWPRTVCNALRPDCHSPGCGRR